MRLEQGTALEIWRNIVASAGQEPKGSTVLGNAPFPALVSNLLKVHNSLKLKIDIAVKEFDKMTAAYTIWSTRFWLNSAQMQLGWLEKFGVTRPGNGWVFGN